MSGRNIGWLDDDCSASAFKVVVDVDGAVGASEAIRVGSKIGETDLDGIDVLVSIKFEEMLGFRSSIGSVDAGRLSLSRGSSMIGEYDRPISIDGPDDSIFVDVVGCCSVCCSLALASTFCSSSGTFASSSAYVEWTKVY